MELLKKYIYLFLLLCILILSFRIRYIDPLSLEDLKPWPDALEYSLSAYNLYHHHILGIKLYQQYYPPQYPYGYPLLIVPFYIIFGSQPYNAVYCTLFFSLLYIVFAYLIGKELGNRFTGVSAALLVAMLPCHIYRSKQIMSDMLSAFLALFICWLLLKVVDLDSRKQKLLLLVLGLVIGFSVSVHITNFLLIPPVLISVLLARKSNVWSWSMVKKQTIILFGIIVALIPLFLYQNYTFGSPLRTGYEVWHSEIFGKFEGFSFKFFAQPHHNYERGNFIAFLFSFTGSENPFYPVSVLPLFIVAVVFIISQRRRHNKQIIFLTFLSILIFSLIIFFSFYMSQRDRYLLRGVSLLMILAACGITFSVKKEAFKYFSLKSIFSIIMLSLFLATIILMIHWSYSHPKPAPWISNRQYRLIQDIERHIPRNAVIISQFNPLIAEHYFTEHTADNKVYISLSVIPYSIGTPWAIIETDKIKPIRYDRAKKYKSLFLSDGTLNPRTYNFVRRSLINGIPVYLVSFPNHPAYKSLLPSIKRYFSLIRQQGHRRLFRLYLKDW